MKCFLILLALFATAFANGLTRPLFNTTNLSARSGFLMSDGNQYIDCYDGPNQSGRSVHVGTTAVPDLSARPYYFDNRIVSCRFNGIYLFYDDYNFNKANLNDGVYAETWGSDYNVNLGDFAYKTSSIRLTGAPNGYKFSTLNFYEGEFYQGAEQFFYDEATHLNFDNFGRSLIVTGCEPWTLYEYDNFQGRAVCFYPADTTACKPGFFRNERQMNGMAKQASSVRRGCFSNTKVYPRATARTSLTGPLGQQGQFFAKQQ